LYGSGLLQKLTQIDRKTREDKSRKTIHLKTFSKYFGMLKKYYTAKQNPRPDLDERSEREKLVKDYGSKRNSVLSANETFSSQKSSTERTVFKPVDLHGNLSSLFSLICIFVSFSIFGCFQNWSILGFQESF